MEKMTLISIILHRLLENIKRYKISKCMQIALKKNPKNLIHWLFPLKFYILKEKRPEKSLQMFEKMVSNKIPGLMVTREYPDKVRKIYDLDGTTMVWLSRTGIENALRPEDLNTLKRLVEIFTSENRESVVFLDGIEYLILHNNFETIVNYLDKLRKIIYLSNSKMIISLHVDTLSPIQSIVLEKNFELL